MPCYLLHYQRGLGDGRNSHYLGHVDNNVERRIAQHRQGKGSAFAREAHRLGIAFVVAAIWPELTEADERRLKNQKNAPANLCLICQRERPRRPRRTAHRPGASILTLRAAEASEGAASAEHGPDLHPQWFGIDHASDDSGGTTVTIIVDDDRVEVVALDDWPD